HASAVIGGIDACNTIPVQFFDLLRQDGTTAAAKETDMTTAIGFQQILHVLEELDMPSLVGSDSDTLHVFFDGAFHDLGDRTVVTQVDDLGALGLHDPAHDIDGGIVPVKKSRGGDQPDFVYRGVAHVVKVGKTNEC